MLLSDNQRRFGQTYGRARVRHPVEWLKIEDHLKESIEVTHRTQSLESMRRLNEYNGRVWYEGARRKTASA